MNVLSVSVIIVNFNGLEHLKNCIPSILNQDYPRDKLEIIVVDNGSSDLSIPFLQTNYPQIILIQNKKNEGFAKPNNQAANIASGEFLVLLNNDMVLEENWLQQISKTQKESNAECVSGAILNWNGSKIDFIQGSINPYGYGCQPYHNDPANAIATITDGLESFYACGGAMLINRDVYLSVGGLDEDFFLYYEDTDLGWRLWILGFRIVVSPKAISYHRHNGTASRFSRIKMKYFSERNSLAMIYKNYNEENYLRFVCSAILLRIFKIAEITRFDYLKYDLRQPRQAAFSRLVANSHWFIRIIRKLDQIFVFFASLIGFTLLVPSLQEKRKKIQETRVRSDEEITNFMLHPESYFEKQPYRDSFNKVFYKLHL